MKQLAAVLPGMFCLIAFAGCATHSTDEPTIKSDYVYARHVNGSQPVAFHRVIMDIPEQTKIGQLHAGILRSVVRNLYWTQNSGIIGSGAFNQDASRALRDCGFTVLGGENQLFEEDNSYKARYQLGATIKEMHLDFYDPIAGNFCEATVLAEWQLQDAFARRIAFTYTNSGYARMDGNSSAVLPRAFGNALRKMIASSSFADLLASNATAAAPADAFAGTISVSLPKAGPARSLPEDMDQVMQGVVCIRAGESLGSGVVISPDGYILTAAHVVSGAKEVAVRFKSGLQLEATVNRVDEEQDIALIQVPGTGHQAVELNLGDPDPVGAELYAIGSPMSEDLAFTVTKGVISGYRQQQGNEAKFIQTDAALNPGNSGGPMLDKSGRVIGIVSHKIIVPGFEGLAFGVPADVVSKRLGIIWSQAKP